MLRFRLGCLGNAAGQRGEFHRLEEGDQFGAIEIIAKQIINGKIERHITLEEDQFLGNAGLLGKFD